ncbi:hypothetical protein ACTLIW_004300, partial [Cronobacter turicensis]
RYQQVHFPHSHSYNPSVYQPRRLLRSGNLPENVLRNPHSGHHSGRSLLPHLAAACNGIFYVDYKPWRAWQKV